MSWLSWRHCRLLTLLLLSSIVFFLGYVLFNELRFGQLTVSFLDVGQGDAIYIDSPIGNHVLIDAGPGNVVLRRLGGEMPFYDRRIDLIVETHPDLDHAGGIPGILARYDVGGMMRIEKKEAEDIPVVIAKRGQVVDLGGGASLKILFPDRYIEGGDTNTKSIVSELVYGQTKVLMTADEPQAVENYLADIDGANLRADILKVGHHGSKTSTSDALLGYVKPAMAIISVGKDNKYGHPNQETLDKLKRFDIPYMRTDEEGTIRFASDGIVMTKK